MPDQDKFINYIAQHYQDLANKYRTYCHLNHFAWDADIYQDTILKCYTAIQTKGKLNDTTPQGIENYFFIAFKLNIKREGQYARNQKRDRNITSDNINDAYEDWYNANNVSSREKLISDLFKDFSTLYLVRMVEMNFPDDYYLFKLKMICGYTYKQLQEKTGEKKIRQRVVNVKKWLMANVKKETIKQEFYEIYGNLI